MSGDSRMVLQTFAWRAEELTPWPPLLRREGEADYVFVPPLLFPREGGLGDEFVDYDSEARRA